MRALKKLAVAVLTGSMVLASCMVSFAGTWAQEGNNWKYIKDDGSAITSCWSWIDGNDDGVYEYYYFNENGIMAADTEVFGTNKVNADGALVNAETGVIKTIRNGVSAEKQTKFMFLTEKEPTKVEDAADALTYTYENFGVNWAPEVGELGYNYQGLFNELGYYEVPVSETGAYREINYYVSETDLTPVGKLYINSSGNSSYVKVVGYY